MAIATFDEARAAVAGGATPESAAAELVAALTPEERRWCLDGDAPTWAGLTFLGDGGYHKAPFLAAQVDRVGLPGLAFSDGPRGCVIGNATAFPVSMARGATWDPDLEERVGDAIGRELRAAGANLTGAVCVNVLRHPAWGRAQETYGEDPHHVGELGAALTRGLQRHVLACVKHLACNSMENARFSVDIEVEEVALHEVYLPHFRRIVDEGVASVMSAYNSVNGGWCGQNRDLLTGVLRDEWGFAGFVISDWIFGLRDAAPSLAAGLDVEMPYRMVRAQHLAAGIDAGEATEADVDAAVQHVVATLLRFDDVLSSPAPPRDVLGAPEHRELAREVAARSVVLLRNEPVDGGPVLPLAAGASLAVVGRLADTVNLGDGGSSDVWDLECTTVLDGVRQRAARVTFDDGADPEAAAAVAAGAEVAVVVVGYTFLDEGEFIGDSDPALAALFPAADEPEVVERFLGTLGDLPPTERPERIGERPGGFSVGGDRDTLRLRPADVELVRAVAAANPRTVVVLQAGSAVVCSEWVHDVPAVVQAWYGGCQAGPGLADVLFGDVNPSARLSVLGPRRRGRPAGLRPGRHELPVRPLARLVAPRPDGAGAGVPLRLRRVVHDVRPRLGRPRPGGRHPGRHRSGPQHRRPRRCRRRPGLRRAARRRGARPARRLRPRRGAGRRRRDLPDRRPPGPAGHPGPGGPHLAPRLGTPPAPRRPPCR
jgi:beta-glucosidase